MSKSNQNSSGKEKRIVVERVQTGVRIEKRMLKVLKGLAEYFEISLGDLLEGIVLHAFEGKCAFTNEKTLQCIVELKKIYGMDYDVTASHKMIEGEPENTQGKNS